jgi:hypothetical protein
LCHGHELKIAESCGSGYPILALKAMLPVPQDVDPEAWQSLQARCYLMVTSYGNFA